MVLPVSRPRQHRDRRLCRIESVFTWRLVMMSTSLVIVVAIIIVVIFAVLLGQTTPVSFGGTNYQLLRLPKAPESTVLTRIRTPSESTHTDRRTPGPTLANARTRPPIVHPPPPMSMEALLHESWFQASIKSCVPGITKPRGGCKTFIADPVTTQSPTVDANGKLPTKLGSPEPRPPSRQQRVGLIAPPGTMVDRLFHLVEDVVRRHNEFVDHQNNQSDQKHNENDPTDVDQYPIVLIRTTHVPPYGYGKNHGYTKLIRVLPPSLVHHVTDTLYGLLHPDENHENVTMADVPAVTRQLLRFHCRLSHVAAHTALLSLSVASAFPREGAHSADDAVATMQLLEFLSPHVRGARAEEESRLVHPLDIDDPMATFESQLWSHLERRLLEGSVHHDDHAHSDIRALLDQVLVDDMTATKNLTAWPCLPFWASGNAPHENEVATLGPISQRLARALSPDCDHDPHAECWVARDKCEAKMDGRCAGGTH